MITQGKAPTRHYRRILSWWFISISSLEKFGILQDSKGQGQKCFPCEVGCGRHVACLVSPKASSKGPSGHRLIMQRAYPKNAKVVVGSPSPFLFFTTAL